MDNVLPLLLPFWYRVPQQAGAELGQRLWLLSGGANQGLCCKCVEGLRAC